MESIKLLEYIRVPNLPGNPFPELNKKIGRVVAAMRTGHLTGGVTARIGTNMDRLNKLKYILMSSNISEDELKKAAEDIETLMAALHRDADLLLTL